jgi:hypothetical protein
MEGKVAKPNRVAAIAKGAIFLITIILMAVSYFTLILVEMDCSSIKKDVCDNCHKHTEKERNRHLLSTNSR